MRRWLGRTPDGARSGDSIIRRDGCTGLRTTGRETIGSSMNGLEGPEYITKLLAQADVVAPVLRVDAASEAPSTNAAWIVEVEGGQRFVVREYRWPYQEREPDRIRKEPVLHQLLRTNGIPAPEVLATAEVDRAAALLEYMPGRPLGEITNQLTAQSRVQAWWSVGKVMRRVHSIDYPTDHAGVIVGEKVRPFDEESWGGFCRGDMIQPAIRLQKRRPDLHIDLDRLRTLGDRLLRVLDDTPRVLLHNDSHPWNVLVQETEGGWECSGVLDWEHAWVGDPTWDLVRMDLFRLRPIGPTPNAYWQGYGRHPTEPEASFYELQISFWMANQYLDGSRALLPTYERAMSYVDDLNRRLSRLDSLLRHEKS